VQPIYEPPAFLDIEGLRSGRQPCLRKLAQSRFVVCASPKYLKRHGAPQRPGDLRNHNCLTFNFRRSRAGWPFRQKGRDIEPLISGNLQVNNGETMKQLVLEGVGVARLGPLNPAIRQPLRFILPKQKSRNLRSIGANASQFVN